MRSMTPDEYRERYEKLLRQRERGFRLSKSQNSLVVWLGFKLIDRSHEARAKLVVESWRS